ncbi:MAG: hypothetical protein N2487_04395 [Verrucomicrobiae bacterium]|nr:hypothetical protein [Verrucomicrobiae bacterium]
MGGSGSILTERVVLSSPVEEGKFTPRGTRDATINVCGRPWGVAPPGVRDFCQVNVKN